MTVTKSPSFRFRFRPVSYTHLDVYKRQPEAGGVSFLQLLDAIRTVSKANIVGADLNELAPMLDISGVSTATACKRCV